MEKLQGTRPTVPEVVPVAAAYFRKWPTWGVFHAIFDDENWQCTMDWSAAKALEQDDIVGYALAILLSRMTRSQWSRVAHRAEVMVREDG